MEDNKAKIEVGLFDGLDALNSYIDDRLIYLRNSDCSKNTFLFFANKQTKGRTKKFLVANGFKLKERKKFLEIEFPDSTKQSDTQHLFFVNTQHEQDKISEIVQKLSSEISANQFIHLLNSDSYFGYYNQQKEDGNTRLVGSPASPANMENRDARPF